MFFSPRKDIFEARMALEQERNPEISPEEYETAAALIQGATYRKNNESPAISIVKEEASAFFAGDKSPEEVAKIIQNRVSIFLSEQS
jgi:multiple sugar transport system substrate-binding protein